MNNYFLACFLLILSHSALASSYQVEVIVFSYVNPNYDGEKWGNVAYQLPSNIIQLDTAVSSGADPSAYLRLASSYNRLGNIYNILQSSSVYRPLLHWSWRQPAAVQNQARHVHMRQQELVASPQPYGNLDGTIRIRSGTYLYVDVDLLYFHKLPIENHAIREYTKLNGSMTDKTLVKIKETRQIKLDQVHYFDHPMVGVILQVTRI